VYISPSGPRRRRGAAGEVVRPTRSERAAAKRRNGKSRPRVARPAPCTCRAEGVWVLSGLPPHGVYDIEYMTSLLKQVVT